MIMGSLTQHTLYLAAQSSSSWAQDGHPPPSHSWAGHMYQRSDAQFAGNCSDYNTLNSLEIYPSDYSVASDSPDPDNMSPGLGIQSSSIRLDTRSYTLSDALRPRYNEWATTTRAPQSAGNQSRQLSSDPESYPLQNTRHPSIDRSSTTTPSNVDINDAPNDFRTGQRVILVKEEREDSLEGLFVLESQTLPGSEVVDTAPNLRFRRPKTPATEAMRKRMTVFHVNPFASSRAQASALTASSNHKREPLEPAFLTFQLCNDTLEPVDDPEIQFFVTFVDECEYDDDSDDGDDPGRYSWPHSVVIKRHSDIYPMKQVPHISDPFSEFTGLTVSGSNSEKSADKTYGRDSSSSSSLHSPGGARSSKHSSTLTKPGQSSGSSKKKPKMHECTVCHKVFPRPSGLSTHMNSHSGDKPFKCPIPTCDKHFTVRSNAKRHLRTHRSLSPSDPIFRGSSSSASGGDIEFDAPLVTHVHETGPKRLRWTRPSVSLRPISELVANRPDGEGSRGGRGWASPSSQGSDYDMDDGREDERSLSEMTDEP